jgi:hypothetical protein
LMNEDATAEGLVNIEILSTTFRELDSLFLAASRRCVALKALPCLAHHDDWKAGLGIEPEDVESFLVDMCLVQEPSDYIRKFDTLPSWRLAIEFMVYEYEGFPGRKLTDLKTPFPTPSKLPTGWSGHIFDVERVAAHLPSQVVEAAKHTTLMNGALLGGVHQRVSMLDRLLDKTYRPSVPLGPRDSFAAQIDRTW